MDIYSFATIGKCQMPITYFSGQFLLHRQVFQWLLFQLLPIKSPLLGHHPHSGIIIAYTVYCNTSATQAFPEQVIGPNGATVRSIVNGTSQLAIFNTGLNPYTQYECFVTANTSVGEGLASPILIVRTGQSSENFTNNLSINMIY